MNDSIWTPGNCRSILPLVMRKSMTRCYYLVLCTVAGSFCACAARMEPVLPLAFAPTERLLVMQGTADARMELVQNVDAAGDFFLRTSSLPARVDDPLLPHLLSRMLVTVKNEGGVGIAAPQVGVNRRVVLVKRLDLEPQTPFRAYVNPKIMESSAEEVVDWEGCLSVPAGFGLVRRAQSIVVAHDLEPGRRVAERVCGFTARIFQHEIDHLDGVLFIDRRESGELMPAEEYREMRRRQKEEEQRQERGMIEPIGDDASCDCRAPSTGEERT